MFKFLFSALLAVGLVFLAADDVLDPGGPGLCVLAVFGLLVVWLICRGQKSRDDSYMFVTCRPPQIVPIRGKGIKKSPGNRAK